MNRVSGRMSHRLTRQALACDSKRQPPLRGRAAAVAGSNRHLNQRAQVRATQVVMPKRAVVSVDDRIEEGAIALPVDESSHDELSQLNPVVVSRNVAQKPSIAEQMASTSDQSSLLHGFSQVWIGWLLMALLLSAWFIVKTVMV